MKRTASGLAVSALTLSLVATVPSAAQAAPADTHDRAVKGCVTKKEYNKKIKNGLTIKQVQKRVKSKGVKQKTSAPTIVRGRHFRVCGEKNIKRHYVYVLWQKKAGGWRSYAKGNTEGW